MRAEKPASGKPDVKKIVTQEMERIRDRRAVFVNGFFWGMFVVLLLIDLIRKFSAREET